MPDLAPICCDDALRSGLARLRVAGIEAPEKDARLLLAAAAGLAPADLFAHPETPLTAEAHALFDHHISRRCQSEPVSRILGHRDFYGRTFRITPATLDPRPETETLIDAALEIARQEDWLSLPIRILDIGTGSGAILVTLLAELQHATGLATDISPAALAVAEENAIRHGVARRSQFTIARSLEGITGPFDLVVSNPPYIASSEIAGLTPDVKDFDPVAALDGGADGLSVYGEIAANLGDIVRDGWVLFEVGAGQFSAVCDLLVKNRLRRTASTPLNFKDLAGHDRCVAYRIQS